MAQGAGASTRQTPLGGLVSRTMVLGFVGAALVMAWLFAVLFLDESLEQPGASMPPTGMQPFAVGGVALGLVLLALGQRLPHCSPEPERRVALAASFVPSLAIAVMHVARPTWDAGVLGVLSCALWLLAGLTEALFVRRTVLLITSASKGGAAPTGGLPVRCSVIAAACILLLVASRMDASGATVLVCCLTPAAAALLPQGRLALPPAPRDSATGRAAGRETRLPRPALSTVVLAVIGLSLGFHAAVGDVLYEGQGSSIAVFVVLCAASLAGCLAAARIPAHAYGRLLQVLVALLALIFASLLLLENAHRGTIWRVCQCVLLAVTLWVYPLASTALEQADQAAGRPKSVVALVGQTAFFAGLACGWTCSALLGQGIDVQDIPFDVATLAIIALLLGTIIALGAQGTTEGVGREAPATAVEAIPLRTGAVDGEGVIEAEQVATRAAQDVGVETDAGTDAGGVSAEPDAGDPGAGAAAPATSGVPSGRAPGPDGMGAPCAEGRRYPGDPVPGNGTLPFVSMTRIEMVAWSYGLSERERDLVEPLVQGLTAQQIANRFTVSRNTVKSHTAHIYAKLGIHTRAELVELVTGSGDIPSDQPAHAGSPAFETGTPECATAAGTVGTAGPAVGPSGAGTDRDAAHVADTADRRA